MLTRDLFLVANLPLYYTPLYYAYIMYTTALHYGNQSSSGP